MICIHFFLVGLLVPSDGKSVDVLGNGFGAQILSKEELLNQLLHKSGKSKLSPMDSEPSLNELLPDITLSRGTYWKHQKTPVSPLLNLAHQNDYLLQGDHFEAELNEQLMLLIPNAPVRKLISHVIRILKMDCTEPTRQVACAKLISRIGLLMKLFSENINETSSLWKSYFWPSKANMTTASSRNLENPLDRKKSQWIPTYGYGNMLLLAISVTAITIIIMTTICVIEICSQHSTAKDTSFLGKRKKTLPDLEFSGIPSPSMEKPLWLKDMYQSQDEIQKNMADQLHDEESLEEVDIVSLGSTRPLLVEPPLKKLSSKTLSVATVELPFVPSPSLPPPPLPPPPPPPAQKPSEKQGSDTVGATPEETSSKSAPSGEGDKEASVKKPESPIAVAIPEAPEGEEAEEEEEGEEEEEQGEEEEEEEEEED